MSSPNLQLMLKNNNKCSYCKNPGHKINMCNDNSIKVLINEAEEITIFTNALFWKCFKYNNYLKYWLSERSTSELKILGYECDLMTYSPDDYVNKLPERMYEKWIISSEPEEAMNKLADFPLDKINKWLDYLCNVCNCNRHNIEMEIKSICMPKHKFTIKVELYNEQNKENKQNKQFVEKKECPICFIELQENIVTTNCEHSYCQTCISRYMRRESINKLTLNCPYCRTNIKNFIVLENSIKQFLLERYCTTESIQQIEPFQQLEPFQIVNGNFLMIQQAIHEVQNEENINNERRQIYKYIYQIIFVTGIIRNAFNYPILFIIPTFAAAIICISIITYNLFII